MQPEDRLPDSNVSVGSANRLNSAFTVHLRN
jgi:hypothetical protein